VDGTLVIPQFVLRSCNWLPIRRFDEAQPRPPRPGYFAAIQKMPQLDIQIVEEDFPNVREVDMKLIELAKVTRARSLRTIQSQQGRAASRRGSVEHQ